MAKQLKKITVVCVIIAYIVSVVASAYALPSDIKGHSAESTIKKWISKGLVKAQSDGKFRPNEGIKRIEFFTYINKIFNYSEKSSVKIADVVAKSTDGSEAAKAVEAGYIKIDSKKKIYPHKLITKAEAAVILAKVFDLTPANKNTVNKFSDVSKIPADSRDAVSALVEKGYMSGNSNGKFLPHSTLTRAQAITLVNKIMGEVYNAKGSYSGTFKGNVVVNTTFVTLKNATIDGDLYVTEGVGNGNVTLDNVKVKGRTIIRGGGIESILIRDSILSKSVIVAKKDGKVRLVATGKSSINSTILNSGAVLEEYSLNVEEGFKDVTVSANMAKNHEFATNGNFGNINIESSDTKVNIDGGVKNLKLAEKSNNISLNVKRGNISQLDILGKKIKGNFSGGTIDTLKIESTALVPQITIAGANIGTFSVNANSKININSGLISKFYIDYGAAKSTVAISSDGKVTQLTNYPGISFLDVKNPYTGAAQAMYMFARNLSVEKGTAAASSVTVTPTDARLTYTSLNPSIASVNAETGLVTGVKEGSAVIVVTAYRVGYDSISTTYTVTVTFANTSHTRAGSLEVSPGISYVDKIKTITLMYTPGENLYNGNVVFSLPVGFMAGTDDEVCITDSESSPVKLKTSQIYNSGRTISLSNLNVSTSQRVEIYLHNTKIPSTNSYLFSAYADVDGNGIRGPSAGTGSEQTTLTTEVTPKIPTPVALPTTNRIITGRSVELSTDIYEATIYYTTDGSTPNSSKTVYTGPIVLNSSVTLKAIAVNEDMIDSDILTVVYTVSDVVPAPEIIDVTATDVSDHGNGADIEVSFSAAEEEVGVLEYRIIVVKGTSGITLAEASSLSPERYIPVDNSIGFKEVVLTENIRDSEGDTITNGNYNVYVLTVSDGVDTNANTLSSPANVVLDVD